MQITFDDLRVAVIMMKRAPLKGDEAAAVAATISKFEGIAQSMLNPNVPAEAASDDTPATE